METTLIINRLKEHLGFKNDVELARYLDLTQAAISGWRTRNSLDYALIIEKVQSVDLNWLFRGDENKQFVISTTREHSNGEMVNIYKDLYEKKCAECDAANQRLDNLIDKLGVFGGKLQSTVTMLNDSGENNYNGEGK